MPVPELGKNEPVADTRYDADPGSVNDVNVTG
jgi:hypothetical protein